MPVYPVAAGTATVCASPGCWCRDRRPFYPSDLTDEQWEVLEPQARQVMRALTVAVGRPMVHDLRAMCDAVAYVVKNGVEWRALPSGFPAMGGGVRVLRAVERPRPAAGADPPPAGVAAPPPGPQGRAHGVHRGLPDRQGPRHRRQGHQRLPRREEDHRTRPPHRRRRRGLALGPGGHRRLHQRQGRREDPAHQAARRVRHPEDHVGRQRLRWRAAGPLRAGRGRDHHRGRQAHRPAHLPGPAPQMGRRAHLRLADALPPPRPRLRAHHRQLRSHDLLGHPHHHDQAPRPLRNRTAPAPTLGRRTHPPTPASGFINRL